ncbi:MAG: hypothetical protein C0617_05585 [Desulfuromonas sp.]|uniref:glycine cleavage system protein R n=1 Tax=Desulfuromonas sp. TaxID=892 RepID=UPI000CAE8E9C|nr:ACT domain-containing protein [Desulfuromonas sp.]PLX85156.1 MAG: hypothetical protein C0617_05585 [Desulfuromonas sp.]
MESRYIMTAFGRDRPGIVADVTKILYENGCNLEDNTMTLLVDEFTLILLFTCPRKDIEEHLNRECRRLERDNGISAFIRPLEERREVSRSKSQDCTLHVEGMDQAGIVYKISRYLADNAVNIVDIKSTVKASPESGTAVYTMEILVQVPGGSSPSQLEDGLAAVAEEVHVDITVSR